MGKTATKQNLVIAFSIVSGKHYCASTLRSELEAAIAAYYKVISEEQGEQDVEIEV